MAKKQKSETPLLPLRPETKGRIDEVKNLAPLRLKKEILKRVLHDKTEH